MTLAICIADRTALTASEVRDLNRAARVLSKLGAASVETVAANAKMTKMTANWALWSLGATFSAGLQLWTLG